MDWWIFWNRWEILASLPSLIALFVQTNLGRAVSPMFALISVLWLSVVLVRGGRVFSKFFIGKCPIFEKSAFQHLTYHLKSFLQLMASQSGHLQARYRRLKSAGSQYSLLVYYNSLGILIGAEALQGSWLEDQIRDHGPIRIGNFWLLSPMGGSALHVNGLGCGSCLRG